MPSREVVLCYLFKNLGYEVLSCDNMQYAYHLNKALVENSHHTLNQQDISFIFQNNENPGFITEISKVYTFPKQKIAWIEFHLIYTE